MLRLRIGPVVIDAVPVDRRPDVPVVLKEMLPDVTFVDPAVAVNELKITPLTVGESADPKFADV